jgi:hypothetical protein
MKRCGSSTRPCGHTAVIQRGAKMVLHSRVAGATAKREVHRDPRSVFDDFVTAIAGHYVCECMPANKSGARCYVDHDNVVWKYFKLVSLLPLMF